MTTTRSSSPVNPTTDEPPARVVQLISAPDAGLPPGWRRVVHESGLPCFVHQELHVVTWTRPYALDAVGADVVAVTKTHVPPLSIFSRRDVGPRHAQLVARRRPSEDDLFGRPKLPPPQPRNALQDGANTNGRKKRKAEALVGSAEPTIHVLRTDESIPLVEVNGKALESPEGKSVHAFLRDFAMAMWKVVPQYTFSKPESGELPIACAVRILDKSYPTTPGPNKPMAKEAAAEAVLEQHIPGYWQELKQQGRVGKYPLVVPPSHQSPPAPQIKEEPKTSKDDKESIMTLDEFKTLTIGDPRVLQACMDLSIKTPAQVVQEYQNRHRGISVNYNTIPHEVDGQKLFKTIVTAGSTAAEGVATTKKVAKQYAAQSLLVMLHQRAVTFYYEVADLYNRGNHDALAQLPLTVQTDTRVSPSKKSRRSPPLHVQAPATAYSQSGGGYNRNGGARGFEGGGYGGYATWQQQQQQQRPDSNYGKKNERIVEYYSPNSGGYGGGYYGDDWGYNRQAPPPSYSAYAPTPYGPATAPLPPASYAAPPPPAGGAPLPSYAYSDSRVPPLNRPKF